MRDMRRSQHEGDRVAKLGVALLRTTEEREKQRVMPERPLADPRTVRAIDRARLAHGRARGSWVDEGDDDDPAAEAEAMAADAIAHLDAGRWDDACACADEAAVLAEDHGRGEVWREFALLVEEAAASGDPSRRG